MPRPKPISATPTLVGLRPTVGTPQPGIAAVYPWRRLERIGSPGSLVSWWVCDEPGRPALLDDRPLVLSVRGERPARLARLAEERAFRNAWRAGDVHIGADGISRTRSWAFLACVLFFSAVAVPLGLKVLLQSPIWEEYEVLDTLGRATILIPACLWIAFLCLPCLIVIFAGVSLRRSQIVSLEYDHRKIKAALRCGATWEAAWDEVRDLRFGLTPLFARLQLLDGQVLWLGPLPVHIAVTLGWIREGRFPSSIERQARQRRKRNRLLVALSVAAAIAIAVVLKHFGHGARASNWLIGAPLLAGICFALEMLEHFAGRQRLKAQAKWR